MVKVDVAIVGLGPAGCVAAKTLAKSGLDIVVIHKGTSTKVCGGLLCEESIDFMSKLNITPPTRKEHF